MSERDGRVCNDESSSLSPRNPKLISSCSVSSTISGGGTFQQWITKRNDGEQQLTLGTIFTIHGGGKKEK